MDAKINIVFVIPSLCAGGTERVMSYIAQHLDKDTFIVTLVVLGFEKDNAFPVNGIEVIYLNKPRVLSAILEIFSTLKTLKPTVVISALSHLNIIMGLMAPFFPKAKFIGREVNIPSVLKNFPEKTNRYYPPILKTLGYKFLDVVICQSNDMFNELKLNSKIKASKLVIINNPITKSFEPKKRGEISNPLKLITIGSLEPRKGHMRILEALGKVDFDFRYNIIGSGSTKQDIFKLAKKLGIHDKIVHIPFTQEVSKYLSENDLFLQGSYVEGFPNALLESCAVGTPVIAFEAPGGINEIVLPDVNGYIARSQEEFIANIKKAMSKTWNPITISESVLKKYHQKIILNKYEDLFISCASK
ncbi:glycosyltransferase [Flagellimonas hymeniacidonis]|uniref:Glycosyltransferase n=1 Tax=Flagellimonas hymeniacidonis TaxID=2603628 RepID=A0A5C8V362_9FLAO|nr:glycosyltransferase [Flagellimonas hymeniacidonis]TXN35974.1 glycosyltransferase [Flagellimonas hymeniacidonis]